MGVINITQKAVDILVNGSQEASFEQRANEANYNVGVSNDSLSWTEVTTIQDTGTYTVTNPQNSIWRLDITDIPIGGSVIPFIRVYDTSQNITSPEAVDYVYQKETEGPDFGNIGGLPYTSWVGYLPELDYGSEWQMGLTFNSDDGGVVSIKRSTNEDLASFGHQYGDEQNILTTPISVGNITQS